MSKIYVQAPMWIRLTPRGDTLVLLYPSCEQVFGASREKIIERWVELMGIPRDVGHFCENPEVGFMIFPHQNLPKELIELEKIMADIDAGQDRETQELLSALDHFKLGRG